MGVTERLQRILLKASCRSRSAFCPPSWEQEVAKPLLCVRPGGWGLLSVPGGVGMQSRKCKAPPVRRPAVGGGGLRLACLLASRSKGGCDKCQGVVKVLCGSREAGGGGDKREPLHQLDFSLSGNHCSEFLGYKCGRVFKGLGGFQSPSPWRQGDGYDDLFVISVQPLTSYLGPVPCEDVMLVPVP